MLFSERLELAKKIDQFIKENNIKPDTFGVVCVLQMWKMLAIPIEPPVSAENGENYVREGELIRKTVAHDETILYIGDSDDQVVIAYPTDLDDFVQVGNYVKITLELE